MRNGDKMKKYTRSWLISAIARRGNFYKKDVDVFLDVLEEIIHGIIADRGVLVLENLFTISITDIKEFKGYDVNTKQMVDRKMERVKIRPSDVLTRILRENKPTTPIDDEEMEYDE